VVTVTAVTDANSKTLRFNYSAATAETYTVELFDSV
jgi:hypothetical protein